MFRQRADHRHVITVVRRTLGLTAVFGTLAITSYVHHREPAGIVARR